LTLILTGAPHRYETLVQHRHSTRANIQYDESVKIPGSCGVNFSCGGSRSRPSKYGPGGQRQYEPKADALASCASVYCDLHHYGGCLFLIPLSIRVNYLTRLSKQASQTQIGLTNASSLAKTKMQ
jgi:hypothetical protein